MTTKILFEGKRAVGIEFVQNGETRKVMVKREVILAAGSVESPKLLEISGIGQGALLQELGVPVIHESKGVGENLQDHVHDRLPGPAQEGRTQSTTCRGGMKLVGQMIKYGLTRKGLLPCRSRTVARSARRAPELETPDMQIHFMAASMDLEVLATKQELALDKTPGLASNPCQLRPESRGSIHAKSPDGTVMPKIVPNYLADPIDQEMAVAAARGGAARSGSSRRWSSI